MATTKTILKVRMYDENNDVTKTINITNPKSTLGISQVRNAFIAGLRKKIFIHSEGYYTSIKSAEKVTTTTSSIE